MTQELIDLRASILEGRYTDALGIVDELEGMSKQAILRQIQSFLKVLLIHLIKNQVEQRLTGSWASSIRNSIREIKKVNIKDHKTSYYVNPDEWECLIEEEVIEDAIADAAEEVFNGDHSQFELAEMMDRNLIIEFQSLIGF
jgi:anthranilate/para-aminobenzoate synthase component I